MGEEEEEVDDDGLCLGELLVVVSDVVDAAETKLMDNVPENRTTATDRATGRTAEYGLG